MSPYRSILITGGAGFIGSNFVRYLLATDPDARIVNLDLLTYAGSLRNLAQLPAPARHTFVQGDITDAGLVLNLAIWVDKWIMWFAPERDLRVSGFISYPDYDTAMFLAYLTVIPAIAGFVVSVETSFFERYLHFYRDIQRHATFAQIEDNQRDLVSTVLRGLRNLVVLQGSITFLAIVLAPRLVATFGLPAAQLGMLRIGMLGSFFHALAVSLAVFLAYFDLRKPMLFVYVALLMTNVGFTLVTLRLGFPYYGYGYFLSALVTFAAAVIVLAYHLDRLPYLTFIRANTSVQ